MDTIDADHYSGYTDLVGVEGRYDLIEHWEVELRANVLHSWCSDEIDYSCGLSLGYNVVKNAWLSIGYNFLGFEDKDFSRASFTAQGPSIQFRFKFDQKTDCVVSVSQSWLNACRSMVFTDLRLHNLK